MHVMQARRSHVVYTHLSNLGWSRRADEAPHDRGRCATSCDKTKESLSAMPMSPATGRLVDDERPRSERLLTACQGLCARHAADWDSGREDDETRRVV